ncbi:MAG: Spy/CpxP family protein refolding chaperone [Hyphomicrobiaceae bacterium]
MKLIAPLALAVLLAPTLLAGAPALADQAGKGLADTQSTGLASDEGPAKGRSPATETMRGCSMVGLRKGPDDASAHQHQQVRLSDIKSALAITPAQAKVWDAYAAVLTANFKAMSDMVIARHSKAVDGASVVALGASATPAEGSLKLLTEVAPTRDALYVALSDAQKKTADKLLAGLGCAS